MFSDNAEANDTVEISLRQGIVRIKSLESGPVRAEYRLSDGMMAEESFPVKGNEGYYHLRLYRNVMGSDEVDTIEMALLEELILLSRAWPFAGGSVMPLETVETRITRRWKSNAEDVRQSLLIAEGKTPLSVTVGMPVDGIATYSRLPLEPAIALGVECRGDSNLRELFEYYYQARTSNDIWFSELYKILDVLKRVSRGKTQLEFNIGGGDLSDFESILNRARHAHRKKPIQIVVARDEKNRVMQIGSKWIRAYMKNKGIDV